jgi:hypothetical protein
VSAAALLAEFEAAGVRLSLAGDALHFQTRPGVGIASFAEYITTNKRDLVMELLQRQIVAAVDVEPERFDRQRYDVLWERWAALAAEGLS